MSLCYFHTGPPLGYRMASFNTSLSLLTHFLSIWVCMSLCQDVPFLKLNLWTMYTWVTSREKVPIKCPESLPYQKKDGRAWLRPPFFWYDTDFLDFFLQKIYFWTFFFGHFFIIYFLKSRSHTKTRAGAATRACRSFGMTTTQAIRDLFMWPLLQLNLWTMYT